MAIGNPGGLQLSSSVTMGYVSALNRAVTNSETGYTLNCIQTDAAINPGNSGGALVDMNGHVVGINSSKIAAVDYEGLGFAIPADTVQPVVSDLIEYGYVKDRPMLGITGEYVDSMRAAFLGLKQGFVVNEVVSENAKASGLQKYDDDHRHRRHPGDLLLHHRELYRQQEAWGYGDPHGGQDLVWRAGCEDSAGALGEHRLHQLTSSTSFLFHKSPFSNGTGRAQALLVRFGEAVLGPLPGVGVNGTGRAKALLVSFWGGGAVVRSPGLV